MKTRVLFLSVMAAALLPVLAFAQAPPDVQPISITCEDCPYPYPSKYFDITTYGQDVRMAYMDVAPQGQPNGHTVLVLHGNNFAGFYFGSIADALSKTGFRVIIPDQMGYGRSSKPIIPYSLNDFARYTHEMLASLNIAKVMVVGHSMGGMLATRFSTQYPDATERLVLYNPIGLIDTRFSRPAANVDDSVERNRGATYASIRASLMRYVAHDPSVWNDEFESYARVRYGWTLGSGWPRLATVQALISNVIYQDPVVYDWEHIQAPTLLFGGAEDILPGSAEVFQQRMKVISETIPNGKARLLLLPGLGHVPHVEDPAQTIPPLVDFLKQGAGR